MRGFRYLTGALLVFGLQLAMQTALCQTPANLAPGLDVTVPSDGLYESVYRLLINVKDGPHGGLQVTSVGQNSPAAKMIRADDRSQTGALETGDIITHVDGTRIGSIEQYYHAMRASSGTITLKVVDRNSGRGIDWEVEAARITIPVDLKEDAVDQNRTIHLLLIGLTNDGSIGTLVANDLKLLEPMFRKSLDAARLDLKVIKGDDCNARFIVRTVRELGTRSRPQDSIMVYYDGHGAYDPRYAKDDPSGGHYFSIPAPKGSPAGEGGDLLRKTLFDNLIAQPGRLKVLITDSCNNRHQAHPANLLRYEEQQFTVRGPTSLEQLLLYHHGVLDINSASQDQSSWNNFFCSSFAELIPQHSEWPNFVKELSTKSNKAYTDWRTAKLAHPPVDDDIKQQTEQKPAVFRIQVEKDKLPTGGRPRVVRQLLLKVLTSEQSKASFQSNSG